MHEDYQDGEEQASKLEVTRDGKSTFYSFMMGTAMLSNQSSKGYVLLDAPSDLAGVAVADSILRVALENGAASLLVDRVVWLLKGSPFKNNLIIGVTNDRPWRASGKIIRTLFCLRLKDNGTVESLKTVAQGDWLPSQLDEEMEGNEAGWKRIEKRWAALIQYDGRVIRYREKTTSPFKSIIP